MAKILVIDDVEDIRIVISELLKLSGYEVDTAEDGHKAKKLYDKTDYDAIITDIIMPEQDGFEVILDFRNKNQLDRVIAISGGGRTSAQDYLDTAKHLGVACVFDKPLNTKDLLAKVAEIVNN